MDAFLGTVVFIWIGDFYRDLLTCRVMELSGYKKLLQMYRLQKLTCLRSRCKEYGRTTQLRPSLHLLWGILCGHGGLPADWNATSHLLQAVPHERQDARSATKPILFRGKRSDVVVPSCFLLLFLAFGKCM